MSTQVSTITAPDGVCLTAKVCGEGPVVLFSNSLAADRSMWREVIAALEGRVTAVTYDTVGHGSSGFARSPLSLADLGLHAIAVADAVGVQRFSVCGLSLGGLTGMWLALNKPGRIQTLTLANTASVFLPPELWKGRAASARTDGIASLVDPTLERWLTKSFRVANPARTEQIRQMIGNTPAEGYAACCEVLAASDLTSELGAIRCPTRVIAGREDPSTTVATAEQIVASIPSAELTTLNAAHLSAVEKPLEFAAEILALVGPHSKREVA